MSERWPRGRYNGRRIVGVRVTFVVDVLRWYWCLRPSILYARCLGLGPLRIWFGGEYE